MAKVKDKATAFKNEIAGSQTNKIICKASSHELAGPKKKHVDCEWIMLLVVRGRICQFTVFSAVKLVYSVCHYYRNL